MSLNYILKIDQSVLRHGNEHHPSTSREWKEDELELGIEWSSFQINCL